MGPHKYVEFDTDQVRQWSNHKGTKPKFPG